MALWFNLSCNTDLIGQVEIRRREHLDLTAPAAIADTINTYDVWRNNQRIGSVRHRYGDGAWRLLAAAADLIVDIDRDGTDMIVAAARAYYRSGGDVDDHNNLMDAVRPLEEGARPASTVGQTFAVGGPIPPGPYSWRGAITHRAGPDD